MIKYSNLTVENKLAREKRDMNVYHHGNKSAHMISHNRSITIPLKTFLDDDFLHISIVSGPGNLEYHCVINLPAWADFEFFAIDKIILSHTADRIILKIPPGPPTWELKITRSVSSTVNHSADIITVGDT